MCLLLPAEAFQMNGKESGLLLVLDCGGLRQLTGVRLPDRFLRVTRASFEPALALAAADMGHRAATKRRRLKAFVSRPFRTFG